MSIEVSIESMSTSQKLDLMERLWADLSSRPQELPSPSWHEEVLRERLESVERGEVAFENWEIAKERLRKRLQ
jgi:hypothetical protein